MYPGTAIHIALEHAIHITGIRIELDPEIAEAHILLADMQQKQWQWTDAEAEYKRALELKPNDGSAHIGLAHWLDVPWTHG